MTTMNGIVIPAQYKPSVPVKSTGASKMIGTIYVDEEWIFTITEDPDGYKIPDELMARYNAAKEEWRKVNNEIDAVYRKNKKLSKLPKEK